MDDSAGHILVVSANAYVGGYPGGVTGNGMRSEPALFAKCPEALIGLLLCEKMEYNESILMKGTRLLATHDGYAKDLKFGEKSMDMTNFGGLLLVDALDFRKPGAPKQWSEEGIGRELTKLHAGFQLCSPSDSISTSHWGCGVFDGNKNLKFLLQLMAASQVRGILNGPDPRISFFATEDELTRRPFNNFFCESGIRPMTVGQIYREVVAYMNLDPTDRGEFVDFMAMASPLIDPIVTFTDSRFVWLHRPDSWSKELSEGYTLGVTEGSAGSYSVQDTINSTLVITPPAKKDFWSCTFYSPLLVKSDASALLCAVPPNEEATIKVDFSYTAISQFDQAGLLLYIDDKHWMKAGIEYCDGLARLSVVVTNGYSDWSTQIWSGLSARLKVHKLIQSDSVVVEAAQPGSTDYSFVRIAHISMKSCESGRQWRIGPYAASPISQAGCHATFSNFSVTCREEGAHSNNL